MVMHHVAGGGGYALSKAEAGGRDGEDAKRLGESNHIMAKGEGQDRRGKRVWASGDKIFG